MGVDVFKVIDQLKDFLKNENDTYLGLLFFLVAELLVINYFIKDIFVQAEGMLMHITAGVFIVTVFAWLFHRHIAIPNNKISIAVANLDIISLDIKKGISGQEKRNLEREMMDYIVDALYGHSSELNFEKYITIINLPSRIQVDEQNAQHMMRKVKANILIWGTAKYDTDNVVYIQPRFEFYREPHGLFYQRFKTRLLDKEIFRVDLNTELKSTGTQSQLTHLIHYLIYVALLFEGVREMDHGRLQKADEVFSVALEKIVKIKNPNKTLIDIHMALKFYRGKNLDRWGNYLRKHRKEHEALLKYDAACATFFSKPKGIVEGSSEEKYFLKNSYLYGVHVLIEENRLDDARSKLDQLEEKMQTSPGIIKEEIELMGKRDKRKTHELIRKWEGKLGKDKEKVLQQVGDFFYDNKAYKSAERYYKKKLAVTKREVYNPTLFDVEDHLHLMHIHLHNLELVKAQRELLTATINDVKNKLALDL